MPEHLVTPTLALASIVAIISYYSFKIHSAIALPPGLAIVTSNRLPETFIHSFAVSVTNPNRHVTVDDTRSAIVPVPHGLSHEQILAKFLSGFFGGYVFASERSALRLFGKQIVNFKGLENIPVSKLVWNYAEIDETQLPPLHSVLFGAFRIVDFQRLSSVNQSQRSLKIQPSHIDIAFGADDGFISGVHRFSVAEIDEGRAIVKGKRHVVIKYDHTSCNPKDNKPLGPEFLQTLHLWYAVCLFREGLVNVLKAG